MTLFWLVVGGVVALGLWFGGYSVGYRDGRTETRLAQSKPARRIAGRRDAA